MASLAEARMGWCSTRTLKQAEHHWPFSPMIRQRSSLARLGSGVQVATLSFHQLTQLHHVHRCISPCADCCELSRSVGAVLILLKVIILCCWCSRSGRWVQLINDPFYWAVFARTGTGTQEDRSVSHCSSRCEAERGLDRWKRGYRHGYGSILTNQ